MEMEKTPEGRIAGMCMAILRHCRNTGSVPDHADFKDGLRAMLAVEIIQARLEALNIPKAKQEAERKRLHEEFTKIEVTRLCK